MPTDAKHPPKIEVADRLKKILETRDLTLRQVSQSSAKFYGRSSRYFIPHNLYYDLRQASFSPALYQFCALSRISNYALMDWLRVFGFSPEKISQLQIAIPPKRTVSVECSCRSCDLWFHELSSIPGDTGSRGILPLAQLQAFDSGRFRTRSGTTDSDCLYVRVGSQDTLAFPDLLPGSIVRVDPRITDILSAGERFSKRIFLIEHSKGLWCSRLHPSERNCVIPVSNQLAYARVELQIPGEARVLGVVDLEIRRANSFEEPVVLNELANQWRPGRLQMQGTGVGTLLRQARRKAGLSFREASAMSRRIADLLGDERYFAAVGSLSDYEAQENPPRHIQKIIALCAIYAVPFSQFLSAAGIAMENLGQGLIPAGLMPEPEGTLFDKFRSFDGTADRNSPWSPKNPDLKNRNPLSPTEEPSSEALRDFFWIGFEHGFLHPSLHGGLLVLVDRHRTKPLRFASTQLWEQPIYLILMRNGKYICAGCTLEDSALVLHPYSESVQRPEKLKNRYDAEVVGQVTTIVRRLS